MESHTPESQQNIKILNMLLKSRHRPAINPRIAVVADRVQLCRRELSRGHFPITRKAYHFTYSERQGSIPIRAFVLIFVKLECPNGHNYHELWLEFVGKGEPLQILSFFTAGASFKDQTEGNPIFNEYFQEIAQIFSGLRFEADVFLRIARILVPRWYEVTIHLEQEPLIEDECMRQFQRLNPFSVRPDLFSLPARPEKRVRSCLPRIEQFSREPAVEVVEEETNQKPSKRRRS
jgi:hypothetical protein